MWVITLCLALYKIEAKAVANRVRVIFDGVIGEQHNFFPRHLITDNVLVVCESIHAIRRRKKGKYSCYAAKVDRRKAYDRVEWHYLGTILYKLGFNDCFTKLLMKCVTSVRFTIKVNGELLPYFTPSRGLRQGGPFSPYLFLICAQASSLFICQSTN